MRSKNSRFIWFGAILSFILVAAFMVGGYSLLRLGITQGSDIALESGVREVIPEAGGYHFYRNHGHFGFGLGRLIFGFFAIIILFKLVTFPLRMMFWGRRGWHGGHRWWKHNGAPWKHSDKRDAGKWVWVADDDEPSENVMTDAPEE